jgi:hypothetical protein
LAGGLILSILAEPTPDGQAKAMKDTLDYMNKEFVSVDAFADLSGPSLPNE